MTNQEDTQNIDINDLLGVDDENVATAKKRLPDASVLRAALVGVLVFVGAAIGQPELGQNHVIDALVSGYVVAAPIALGWWIQRHSKQTAQLVAPAESDHVGKHCAP